MEPVSDNSIAAPELIASPLPAREPFWGWLDLLIVLGLLVAMVVIITVATLLLSGTRNPNDIPPVVLLLTQLGFYGAIFLALLFDVRVRYNKPVFESLGWRRTVSNRTLLYFGLAGFLLAPLIDGISVLLHTPEVHMDILDQLAKQPVILATFGILAITAAPVFEELLFRGFLQPLFSRTLGTVVGILLTSVLFGSLHAMQYKYVWQYVAAISLVGAILGAIRFRTKSIIPGIVMHACFNSVASVGIFFQHK